jgi:hypothetical protein
MLPLRLALLMTAKQGKNVPQSPESASYLRFLPIAQTRAPDKTVIASL